MNAIHHSTAENFLTNVCPNGVDLFLIDPPYMGIMKDSWDNQWKNDKEYAEWLVHLCSLAKNKISPTGSLIVFQGTGSQHQHPLFRVVNGLEDDGWCYRNWITWKKRRAYGKSHDYLYCREEILWFSRSSERKEVEFNIPLTSTLRGYDGFSKKYPAKSKFKRVSNVWDDIPELMRPKRSCEKPLPLLKRLIETHSQPGQLVVDFFAGTGSTCLAAVQSGRNTLGCEAIEKDAINGNKELNEFIRREKASITQSDSKTI